MKSSKIWKIVWVAGIYAILFAILYLVIIYKVEWEDKDLNTYLYFYDCSNNLCTSTTLNNDYYSKIMCEDDICPYIKEMIGNNVILERDGVSWIYSYMDDKIIDNKYIGYRYLDNDLYVVTDKDNKQGIINSGGEVLVLPQYEYIDDYLDGFISYKEDNLYGIHTGDGVSNVDANFEDIVLINDTLYAGKKNNAYNIYSYKDSNYVSASQYNYLDSYMDVIFTINDKKIDIMTIDMKSTLLMKIKTFYEYTTEKERESLNLHSDGEYLYFDVFTSETEYTSYKYNIASKKIV